MRSIALVVLALAIISVSVQADAPTMSCRPILSFVVFDLTSATNDDNYNITNTETNETITFNICQPTKYHCHEDYTNYAMINKTVGETNSCISLTGNQTTSGFDYALLNSADEKQGVSVTFGPGEASGDNKYRFTLRISCNADVKTLTVDNYTVNGTEYTVNAHGSMGCPQVNPSELWDFFTSNKWIFTPVCLILGALLTFVGFRLSKFTFFTIGFVVTFVPITLIFFTYVVKPDTGAGVRWAVLAIAIIIGILFGIIAVRLEKVGFFLIGFGLAFAIATLIHTAFLMNVEHDNLIFFGIWLVLGIIVGLLMAQFKDPILILTTSIVGAYLMVRPVFQLIDPNLPSEFQIKEEIKLGHDIPVLIYIYLGVWLLVTGAGLYVQIVKKKAMEKERESPPDYLAI